MIGARVSNKHFLKAKKLWGSATLALLLSVATVAPAYAVCPAGQQSCSSNFSVGEAFFGNGGQLNACSATYCTKQALGETGVGNTSSTTYQAQAGFNSNRNEYIEINVNTTTVDFGVLTNSSTHVGTAAFNVKAYVANGYQVVSSSTPPKNGSYTMAAPSTPTASAVGTEQFGMNVVGNTCPGTAPGSGSGSCTGALGSNPVQVPGATYSYGQAGNGTGNTPSTARYDQTNQYMYRNGDVIAYSAKSSGETDYTISYIMNISSVTPGGTYSMVQSLVATATF
jgi:hypothetical protein